MTDSSAKALRVLAETHRATVLKNLPTDRTDCFALFVEVVRTMDYWGTHASTVIGDSEQVAQSFDLMCWGRNRAIAELFDPLEQLGTLLLMESTQRSREFASSLMQDLGMVSLLRRLTDQSKSGIMEIIRDDEEFHIRMTGDTKAQFADSTELDRCKAAEERLSSTPAWALSGWRRRLA